MNARREARRIGILVLAAAAAGCHAESPPGGEGGAAQHAPRVESEALARPRRAHGQARVEEIVGRSRTQRDQGTIAAGTALRGPPGSGFADVFEAGLVERLDPVRGGLEPVIQGSAPRKARVTLPGSASGAFRVEDAETGASIAIQLEGAGNADVALAHGLALWEGGGPEGGDVIARVHDAGVEDYVVFERRPSAERLVYHVDVSAFAGLRLVDRVLELLDAGGVPRLRMARPYVGGADARRIEASVGVRGCAVDTNPAPPYDRPTTPPGAASCAVVIGWKGAAYPAVVDPNWTSTANVMTSARTGHVASKLINAPNTDKVLVAGGSNGTSNLSSAELFDPASNTFAAIAAMSTPRLGAGITGKFVSGGFNAGNQLQNTAEYWLSNVWNATATPMSAARANHVSSGFSSTGEIFIAGGIGTTTAERFTLMTMPGGTFYPCDPLSEERQLAVAVQYAADKVWVIGGYRWNGANVHENSVDVYDATGKRTAGPTMTYGHALFGATLLSPNHVLVHTGNSANAGWAEVWDGATWSPIASPWRRDHRVVTLNDGSGLVVGHDPTALRYDPVQKAFFSAGTAITARENHTATTLTDGRVLVTGGHLPGASTPVYNTAELFGTTAQGTACTSPGECGSLHCVDSVCCDTACTGLCQSCVAATKASGPTGTCGPAKVGTDPHNQCAGTAQSTCMEDGTCNGTGACRKWLAGTPCKSTCGAIAPNPDTQTDYGCNGAGSCTMVLGSKACTPNNCADASICAGGCSSLTPCATNYYCDAGICKPQKAQAEACSVVGECASGLVCAQGVCCDSACPGDCESCALPGSMGACTTVPAGQPSTKCQDITAKECGKTGLCSANQTCELQGTGTACGPKTCLTKTSASSECDGIGNCVASPMGIPCSGFICKDGACLTSCLTSAECSPETYCDSTVCVARKTPGNPCASDDQCSSDRCVNGSCTGICAEDCGRYTCTLDGKCRETCTSTANCTKGNACSEKGTCAPDSETPAEPPGCACRTPGGEGTPGSWTAAGLAAAALRAAGRRRRRNSRGAAAADRFGP
jgi:hypothetical protein